MTRSSQYRNVFWYPRVQKWIAKIHLREHPIRGDVTVDLDYHKTEEDAARVADVARAILAELGLLGPRTDPTPTFDGRPPDSYPFARVAQKLLQQQIISPEQLWKIVTPQK